MPAIDRSRRIFKTEVHNVTDWIKVTGHRQIQYREIFRRGMDLEAGLAAAARVDALLSKWLSLRFFADVGGLDFQMTVGELLDRLGYRPEARDLPTRLLEDFVSDVALVGELYGQAAVDVIVQEGQRLLLDRMAEFGGDLLAGVSLLVAWPADPSPEQMDQLVAAVAAAAPAIPEGEERADLAVGAAMLWAASALRGWLTEQIHESSGPAALA